MMQHCCSGESGRGTGEGTRYSSGCASVVGERITIIDRVPSVAGEWRDHVAGE